MQKDNFDRHLVDKYLKGPFMRVCLERIHFFSDFAASPVERQRKP